MNTKVDMMSNDSNNISIPQTVFVDEHGNMINFENIRASMLELLSIIRDLEKRVSDLDGK